MKYYFLNECGQLLEPSSKGKGTRFELQLVHTLLGVKNTILYTNVILPYNGGTTEIDLVLLGKKAVYCFEAKAFTGRVYGKISSMRWAEYINGRKFEFYNPVKQNRKHCLALRDNLGDDSIPVISVVVFSDSADITKVLRDGLRPTEFICSKQNLLDTLVEITRDRVYMLSDEQYASVATTLEQFKVTSYGKEHDHVTHLREKHHGDTCPLCGAKLVKRVGRTEFLGCANFPKCKYTRPINTEE